MNEPTREEHLAWCKERALREMEYYHDPKQGFASMASDMGKHPETENHAAIKLGMMLLMSGHLSTEREMKKFIEGFN
jgi:hypothetical protein